MLVGALTCHMYADYKQEKRQEALIDKAVYENHKLYESVSDMQQKVDSLEDDLAEANQEIAELKKREIERQKVVARKQVEAKAKAKAQESQGQTFHVTHYTATCKGCSGITKTGVNVKNTIYFEGYRIIAVDTNLIPLGSIVEMSDGKRTFKAIAIDVGGGIRGNEIDLLVGSVKEALALGKKDMKVRFIRKGW
jgi:3D (Asp-Asp-Asp) domain-containing protein